MNQVPVLVANKELRLIMEHTVNQILTNKSSDPMAGTSALEAEIDRLVYGLYGLTDAEIAIVEGR